MRTRTFRRLSAALAMSAAAALAGCEKKSPPVEPDSSPLPDAPPAPKPAAEDPPVAPPAPAAQEPSAPRTGTPDVPAVPPEEKPPAEKPVAEKPPAEKPAAKPAPKPPRPKPSDAPAARGGKVALPEAPPLTEDAARTLLLGLAETSHDPHVIRAALLGVAETSGLDAVRTATAKAFATGSGAGGFEDADSAATALEALLRAGGPGAPARAIALAKAGIDKDEVHESFATMLAAVGGDAAPEARKLLVSLTEDPDAAGPAARALAPLREPSAAARLHELATDAENVEAETRAAAAAALLALGDPRAQAVLESLVHGTTLSGEAALDAYALIDGLAIPGLTESLPWIRKLADPAIKEDVNPELEIRAFAGALADVRGAGKGTKEDMDALASLLGKAHGLADDDVLAALWALGDDTRAEAAANALAACVRDITAGVVDEESGVQILGWVAARRAAASPPFRAVVDAAAAATPPKDTKREDAAERVNRLRVAAARAFLASAKP